jgi:hypothetical protein
MACIMRSANDAGIGSLDLMAAIRHIDPLPSLNKKAALIGWAALGTLVAYFAFYLA